MTPQRNTKLLAGALVNGVEIRWDEDENQPGAVTMYNNGGLNQC